MKLSGVSVILVFVFSYIYWFMAYGLVAEYFPTLSSKLVLRNLTFHICYFVLWLILTGLIVFLVAVFESQRKPRDYKLGHGSKENLFSYGEHKNISNSLLHVNESPKKQHPVRPTYKETNEIENNKPYKNTQPQDCESGSITDYSNLHSEKKDTTNCISVHEVKEREKTDLKIKTNSNRLTFHPPALRNSVSSKDLEMKDLSPQNSQLHKQESFIGIPKLKDFDSLTSLSVDTPVTPMSPREKYFIDFYKAAELEEERRCLLYLSSPESDEEISPRSDNKPKDKKGTDIQDPVKNENVGNKHPKPRLPSVVEILEKNGNRLSFRESSSEDNNLSPGEHAVTHRDSQDGLQITPAEDDNVFSEVAQSSVSEFFMGKAFESTTYTTEKSLFIEEYCGYRILTVQLIDTNKK